VVKPEVLEIVIFALCFGVIALGIATVDRPVSSVSLTASCPSAAPTPVVCSCVAEPSEDDVGPTYPQLPASVVLATKPAASGNHGPR
jgi:hypothetical protein